MIEEVHHAVVGEDIVDSLAVEAGRFLLAEGVENAMRLGGVTGMDDAITANRLQRVLLPPHLLAAARSAPLFQQVLEVRLQRCREGAVGRGMMGQRPQRVVDALPRMRLIAEVDEIDIAVLADLVEDRAQCLFVELAHEGAIEETQIVVGMGAAEEADHAAKQAGGEAKGQDQNRVAGLFHDDDPRVDLLFGADMALPRVDPVKALVSGIEAVRLQVAPGFCRRREAFHDGYGQGVGRGAQGRRRPGRLARKGSFQD